MIFAIIALYAPALALPACVFLGPSGVPCFLTAYYGLVMTKRYPSRFITPVMIGISFAVSVLILGFLIEVFRDNTALLYTVYLAIAVALAVLYLAVEPYLLYSFRGRRLISEEGIGEIAGQEEGENGSAVVCRAEAKPAEPVPAELPRTEPALAESLLTKPSLTARPHRPSIQPYFPSFSVISVSSVVQFFSAPAGEQAPYAFTLVFKSPEVEEFYHGQH